MERRGFVRCCSIHLSFTYLSCADRHPQTRCSGPPYSECSARRREKCRSTWKAATALCSRGDNLSNTAHTKVLMVHSTRCLSTSTALMPRHSLAGPRLVLATASWQAQPLSFSSMGYRASGRTSYRSSPWSGATLSITCRRRTTHSRGVIKLLSNTV